MGGFFFLGYQSTLSGMRGLKDEQGLRYEIVTDILDETLWWTALRALIGFLKSKAIDRVEIIMDGFWTVTWLVRNREKIDSFPSIPSNQSCVRA